MANGYGQAVKSGKNPWRSRFQKGAFPYLLLSPMILLLLIFLAYPIFSSIYISFTNLNPGRLDQVTRFVGLDNYIKATTSPEFLASVGRSIYLTMMSVIFTLVMGLSFALVLNQPFPFRNVVRTLIIVPWAVPKVISGVMWKWIYSSQFGALNGILFNLGIIQSYQAWLGSPFLALNLIVVANLWKNVPFAALMCLAALSAIPDDLYEASKVDGSSVFQRFQYITLPLVMPTIVILMVLSTAWAFYAFDLVYVMTEGGPAEATTILPFYAYLRIFKFLQFGEGSAIAYIITLFVFLISWSYIKLLYREINT